MGENTVIVLCWYFLVRNVKSKRLLILNKVNVQVP
jgi:hypothetical protein